MMLKLEGECEFYNFFCFHDPCYFGYMVILKSSTKFQTPKLVLKETWIDICFCIEDLGLTFSFVHVKFYVAIGKGSITPYSFVIKKMEIRK
jgi:hypothetical protein